MGKHEEPYKPYQGFHLALNMASSSQQPRINRNSAYNPPVRSQSMYLPRHGLEEPEILKRRVRSTRGKRSRKSTLFSSRSIPKIPQVENSTDLFVKVIHALRCCANNLKDTIHSSPITAKRSLEQKLRWCEDRLSQIEGLYEFYTHENKMRQGARNLEAALLSYGVKHGQEKCKSNYKESTVNMCEIEDEFERRMGRYNIKVDGLDGFARLCVGDNFEIFVRNGSGRKWKAKCKIERDGQKWTDNEVEVKGSLKDGMFFRIIELKKISANAQLGSFSVRLRNYISANPMNLSIPVNKTGNLKLRVTIHWQPLSSKEEQKIKKTDRESLLSDVFFGSPVNINHDEPPRISVYSPPGFSPSSPSTVSPASNTTFPFEQDEEKSSSVERVNDDLSEQELSISSEMTSDITTPDFEEYEEEENDIGLEPPPPPQLPQPSTLDQLIRKLQLALVEHKDQHPQLQQLYEKLEKLDEILKGGKLRKCKLTGSVESALESFSFLDITEIGVRPDREIRPFDTGYCSNDESLPRVEPLQMNGETSDMVIPPPPEMVPLPQEMVPAAPDMVPLEIVPQPPEMVPLPPDMVPPPPDMVPPPLDMLPPPAPDMLPPPPPDMLPPTQPDMVPPPPLPEILPPPPEMVPTPPYMVPPPHDMVPPPPKIIPLPPPDLVKTTEKPTSGSGNSSLKDSKGSGLDVHSSDSLDFSGITIIDKVLHQHLMFCLRLTEDFGSIGPLKSKESSAVIKLEWQCGILEKLLELANTKYPPQTISKAYSPLAASGHDEILLFWAGNCGENPLYITSSDFLQALRNQFHQVVEEAYSRIADRLYPVITTRILEENGSLIAANIEDESVISIYQFTDYFLIDQRWNLVSFVNDVAEELLTCGRLLNTDKPVVLTQLQMYNKIPFKHSCCVTAARLLADPDPQIVSAAGIYFETLLKDRQRRAQAVSYCTEALEDGDEIQRVGACTALERLQGNEALEQLTFLAKCDTNRVKEAAQRTITSFGVQLDENVSEQDKDAKIWKQTTKMLDLSKSTDF